MPKRTGFFVNRGLAAATLCLLFAAPLHAASYAYIALEQLGEVLVIDTSTGQTVNTLTGLQGPFSVAVTQDGTRLYVTDENNDTVTAYNTSNYQQVATVALQHPPYGITVLPDGSLIFVSTTDNNVLVFDPVNNFVTHTIPIPKLGRGIVASPDGNHVYVVSDQSDVVSVIGTSVNYLNEILSTIVLPAGYPIGITISPDGSRLYVASDAGVGGMVYAIDTTSLAVITQIALPAQTSPVGIAVSPDGKTVYTANAGNNTVSVIDTASGTVTANVQTGAVVPPNSGNAAGPLAVSVTPDGTKVYATSTNCQCVYVIDTATNTVSATIQTPAVPSNFGAFITPPPPFSTVPVVSILSSRNPSPPGDSIMLTAQINPANVSGTITFTDGQTVLGSGTLYPEGGSPGYVSITLNGLAPGTHQIVASYSGDATHPAAQSPAYMETIGIPQTGYWWYPAAPGSGYFLEQQGDTIFIAAFMYDTSGNSIWYATGPYGVIAALEYETNPPVDLIEYLNGQTLTGPYQAPTTKVAGGPAVLSFYDAADGNLGWEGVAAVPITRFNFGPGGAQGAQPAGTPESGFWYAPSEPGRGYTIEVQGGTMFLAGYMYGANGNPVWYSSGPAPMASLQLYEGVWQQFGGGQSLGGQYVAATVANADVGNVSVQFSDTRNATLTLPTGRQVAISRFSFGGVTLKPATVTANLGPGTPYTVQIQVSSNYDVLGSFTGSMSDPNGVFQTIQNSCNGCLFGGTMTFNVNPNLAAGNYTGTASLTLCLDTQCKIQIYGSPVSVPFNITVNP